MLVFIGLERFIAVVFYMKAKKINTVRNANIVIVCTVVIYACFLILYTYLKEVKNGICLPPGASSSLANTVVSHTYGVVSLILPHVLLLIFNISIAVKFRQQSLVGTTHHGNRTVVLMATMILFLALTTPIYILNAVRLRTVVSAEVVKVMSLLTACNYSMNFFIYLIIWKSFRKTLFKLLGIRQNSVGIQEVD